MASDKELHDQYLREMYEQEMAQGEPGSFSAYEAIPEIEQEMHPDISLETRAIVKNLSVDPQASVAFVKKRHPGLDVKLYNNQILAKNPSEGKWRALDPYKQNAESIGDVLGAEALKETGRDILDVGYDVGSGVVEGVSAAGAGLAGALATGGWGAIPAAMVAGGAVASGSELAKQKLGQEMGIPQDYNMQDALISGGLGAAMPLGFGTGAGMKQALKTAAKKGLSEEAGKKLAKSQRGAVGGLYDATVGYVGPKLGALASGESDLVIKEAAQNLDLLKQADKAPEVRTDMLEKVSKDVRTGLKDEVANVGKDLNALRNSIDQPVTMGGELVEYGTDLTPKPSIPTASFLEPFEALHVELTQNMTGTAAEQADMKKLAKIVKDEFLVKGEVPEMMTSGQVQAKYNRFKKIAEKYGLKYKQAGTSQSVFDGASPLDAQIASAFEQSRKNMNAAIVDRLEQISPGSGDNYERLRDYFSELKGLQKQHKTNFKGARNTSRTLTSSLRDDTLSAEMRQLKEVTGVDLEKAAISDEALKVFSKPKTAARSVGGSTSTSRTIPMTETGGLVGATTGAGSGDRLKHILFGRIIGGVAGSPAAQRKYMQWNRMLREGLPGAPGYGTVLRTGPKMLIDESESY